MTVSTSHAVVQYNGSGFQQTFEVDFQFFEDEDLLVTLLGVGGTETVQTLSTHYVVTGGKDIDGKPAVGEVFMVTPPASGEKIRFERLTAPIQALNLRLGSTFGPAAVEASLDRSLLLDQENALTAARSVHISMTNYLNGDSTELPQAAALRYLRWDEDAEALESAGGLIWLGDWVTSTPYAVFDLVRRNSSAWICKVAHTSGASTEPGLGASYATVWDLLVSKGDMGAVGVDAGVPWIFDTSTTMADPSAGNLRLNNAALGSVTQIAISYNNALTGNPSVGAYVQSWDDSDSNTERAFLLIRDSSAPQNFAIYSTSAALTNNGTWAQIPVTHIQNSGTLSGQVTVQLVRVGNRGTTGAGSGNMLGANNLSDVVSAATSFANIKQAATTSVTGVAELATDAEAQAETDTVRVITPSNLAALAATTTLAGLVEAATDTEAAQGTDTTRYFSAAQLHEAQADVASASTTNIGAAASNNLRITGAVTITAFDNVAAGVWRTLRFEQALTLTHNATSLILPSAANIITALNDCCLARSLGSGNWLVLWYQKANGQALASSGSGAPSSPQGRITLTSNTPVMTSSVAGATTCYYTPYLGRHVPLYNGSSFVPTDTGGELSQATSDTSKSPAAVAADKNYDIFVWDNAGTIRATRGPAWSSDTSRGTGAGTTELVRVNGILLNNVDITNGPAASRGTYVGTIRSNGSSQLNWVLGSVAAGGGAAILGIWNQYNRVLVETFVGDNTNTWSYAVATWRSANNNNNNRISYLIGRPDEAYRVDLMMGLIATNSGGTSPTFSQAEANIGIDSTSAPASGLRGWPLLAANLTSNPTCVQVWGYGFATGWHFAQAIERADATGTGGTYRGDNGATNQQTGIAYRGRH